MTERQIAALFVQEGGCYFDLPGVDPWPESRDARLYPGPWPVVAHPPCERWGRYWYGGPMLHKLGRRLKRGDDGGCFAAAITAIRRFGGVLEHPEASSAWSTFGLITPVEVAGSPLAMALGGRAAWSRAGMGTVLQKRRGSTRHTFPIFRLCNGESRPLASGSTRDFTRRRKHWRHGQDDESNG